MPNEQDPFPLSDVLVSELEAIKGEVILLTPDEAVTLRAALDRPVRDTDGTLVERSEQSKLRLIYDLAHNFELSALCLSGGGIRSAAFSLGIIQALADRGLLQKFEYLSTVSGGGYIGAWLSARLHRTGNSDQVMKELRSRRENSDSEAKPIEHLREYSSYLTPKVGLLSADTWTALAIILRNTLLNWLILVPLICLPVIAVKVIAALVHTGRFGYAPWGSATAAAVCCLLLVLSIGYQLCRLYVSREISPAATEQKWFLWLSVLSAAIVGGGVAWLANQQLEHQGLTLADALLAPTNASSNWHELRLFAALVITGLLASAFALLGKRHPHWFCLRVKDAGWIFLAWMIIGLFSGLVMWVGEWVARYVPNIWHRWGSMAALGIFLYGLTALGASALARRSNRQLSWPRLLVKDAHWIFLAWIGIGLFSGFVMWVGEWVAPNVPSIWHGWGSMAALGIFLYGLTALGASAVARRSKLQPPWDLCVKDAGRNILAWAATGLLWGSVMWVGVRLYWMIGPLAIDRQVLLVVFGLPWLLLAMRVGQLVYIGGRSYSRPSDFEREWLGRAAGWFLIVALAWIVLSILVLLGTALYQYSTVVQSELPKWVAGISGASGAVTAFLGMSSFSPGRGRARDWKGVAANVGLAVAGPLFAGTLLILLSMLFDWVVVGGPYSQSVMFTGRQVDKDYCSEWVWTGGVSGVLIFIMVAADLFINVNRFSLHALYRNRLIRAFLGGANDPGRRPDGFTGFDQYDNLRVGDLWPSEPGPHQDAKWRPFHIINMTLNLASTGNLAWQQRKGISFTVTPKFCGAAGGDFGYRRTKEYGDPGDGISLGTAMAISGAAVSPNMGYHSSPSIAFLLTFFNVRLGWWLGNPGAAGERMWFERMRLGRHRPYQTDAPRSALWPLLSELFGLTKEDSRFVYLSDGGHFENFGLYEMVRRRCQLIIICDGAQDRDRKFEDLGNAVRKIWIDLGVRVELRGFAAAAGDRRDRARRAALFRPRHHRVCERRRRQRRRHAAPRAHSLHQASRSRRRGGG